MARTLLLVSLEQAPVVEYRQGFAAEGYGVDSAYRADYALAMAAMHLYDAILVFAPSSESTRELVSRLCESDWLHPVVLCITAATPFDEVNLLRVGAVACRSPDVCFAELLATVRALLDRAQGYPQHYRIGDLGIDPIKRRASRQGLPLSLRPTEFDLLLRLAESKGKLVRKEFLIQALWPEGEGSSNLLSVHVRNLRAAMEGRQRHRLLHTVRNLGYVLSDTLKPGRRRFYCNYQLPGATDARAADR